MTTTQTYTLDFNQIGMRDLSRVGGKNASLGQLHNALKPQGVGVLDGFATTAEAYWRLLGENGLYRLICKRTRAAFDKRINPHLFRSCLATSTAVHHGAQMGLAITVLRHQNSEDIELHYNQAKMIDAVRAYQEMLLGDA